MIFSIDARRPDASALKGADGTALSYGGLCAFVREMGALLADRCLAFCMCKNMPGAAAGYLAMLEHGTVPLLLDASLREEQLLQLYRVYEPSLIWAPEEFRPDGLPGQWEELLTAFGFHLWRTSFAPAPMNEALALLLATSGSTGSPKLVRLSRTNLEANAASICAYLALDEAERPITTLPMQYTYGLSIINSHLLAGACVLMTPHSYVQREFWDFFAKEHPTSFGGVPYTYEILKKMHVFRRPLPGLHSITQAGGRLSPELQAEAAQWASRSGAYFYVMYGQTEATARMSYLPPEKCLEKPGSIGIAIPGGAFFLVDENGETITESDQVGELLYEGPNVSLGYAQKKEDLLLGDVNHGLLKTGDLARRDADGYYYIVGRKKRFVKIFGVRVGLDACEQVLRAHFPETEFACAGSDNHLEIYGTNREAIDQAAAYLSEYLGLNSKGFKACYLEEIPKNASGKIQYTRLSMKPR